MKKLIIYGIMAMMSATVAAADTLTLKTLFVAMPDSVMPYLSRNNRLDFIDFIDSNMKAEVTNELGGKSQMTALAEDSISIRMNEACRIDLLLLNTENSTDSCHQVIALVRTLGLEGGYEESIAEFYSTSWNRLSVQPLLTDADEKRLQHHIKSSSILNFIKEKLNKD